jgi:hypothetical protein
MLLLNLTKRYEKPLRLTNSDKELPMSVLLNTGTYKLPAGFSCEVNASFSSKTPTGFPDVIIKGSGNASGARSWSGMIFEGVKYSSSEGKQKFYNCIFRNGTTLKLDSCAEFYNCRFMCQGLENTPLELGKNCIIQDCVFEDLGSDMIAYINFRGDCSDPSLIRNTTFNFELSAPSVGARRRFSPINISGASTLVVEASRFNYYSENAEVILFSSCGNASSVNLNVSETTAINRSNEALYSAVLSNLWSNGGSISFRSCTFQGMRMLLYGALRCSHLTKCSPSDNCSHLRKADSDWKQSLTITNTNIRTETQSDVLAAAFDLSDVNVTDWSLSFLNSTLFVNRNNIPFNVVNGKTISLNILGSSFLGTQQDPINQQPWLNIETVEAMNILTSPSTSFINLAPASRSGTIGTITVINAGGIPLNQNVS